MERMSFNQILANMSNTFHLDTTKLRTPFGLYCSMRQPLKCPGPFREPGHFRRCLAGGAGLAVAGIQSLAAARYGINIIAIRHDNDSRRILA